MKKPSAEVRRRVEQLLDKLGEADPPSDLLRPLRMLEVLEHIATPPAQQLVEKMAKGRAEAQLTREAKATLRRWAK